MLGYVSGAGSFSKQHVSIVCFVYRYRLSFVLYVNWNNRWKISREWLLICFFLEKKEIQFYFIYFHLGRHGHGKIAALLKKSITKQLFLFNSLFFFSFFVLGHTFASSNEGLKRTSEKVQHFCYFSIPASGQCWQLIAWIKTHSMKNQNHILRRRDDSMCVTGKL